MNDPLLEYHAVAQTGDLEDEEVLGIRINDRDIAIYRIEGEFYATDGICTHEYVGLADGFVEGDIIECPLHGGKFEIKTGKPAHAPVTEGLKTHPVRIDGDTILVGIEAAAQDGTEKNQQERK